MDDDSIMRELENIANDKDYKDWIASMKMWCKLLDSLKLGDLEIITASNGKGELMKLAIFRLKMGDAQKPSE